MVAIYQVGRQTKGHLKNGTKIAQKPVSREVKAMHAIRQRATFREQKQKNPNLKVYFRAYNK